MIELFSGIGAQQRGFEQTELFNIESIGTSDLDKEVICSYAAIHCGMTNEMIENYEYPSKEEMIKTLTNKRIGYDFKKDKPYDWAKLAKRKDKTKGIEKYWLADKLSKNLGDITQIENLPKTDILTYSAPCFVEGTLVFTDNGYKQIEEVEVGDYVLTHTNTYQKVVRTMTNETDKLIRINSMPSEALFTTPNHPFYVRKRYNRWSEPDRRYIRLFEEPAWVEAKNLSKEYYVGTAINTKSELPQWNGIDMVWTDGRKTRHKNDLSEKFESNDFWYVIGRYIGDGWLRKDRGITICGNEEEIGQVIERVEKAGFNYCVSKQRTVHRVEINLKEIYLFCSQFGSGASNKHLTSTIFNLPEDKLKYFLEGYIDADGSFTQNKFKISSVSRRLIYDVTQCIEKVYKRPCSVYFTARPKIATIEGRVVNQKDSYTVAFKDVQNKQDKSFYEDGYIWSPINEVSEIDEETLVYNLEVENDNSYMVQNIIVHNCTDWSVAGQQEGGDWTCRECGFIYSPYDYKLEDRYSCPNCSSENIKSTRSGLLFEVERLLADLVEKDEAPKYLFCENVDALISKKFKPAFDAWISRLEELGYNTYYDCVNSKFCGIPQNRNRLFAISVRKDIDTGKFEFPKPFDSGLRLKDLLETDYEVIEKYFLSDEVQQRLQITDPEFVKSIVGTTKPEFRTIGQRDLVYQKDSIMGALVATDYKQPKQILEDTNTPNRLFNIYGSDKGTSFAGNVYDEENICPTINTCQGGNRQPLLCADNEEKKMRLVRKLTPKEAHRLMGFRDEDYDKCKAIGMSDTQGYCQAGNSIVTDVVSLLAQHIYKAQYDNTYECLDETFNNRNESDTNKIMIVGNYMPSNHDASRVVDEEGIAPCVKENHGTVTGVLSRNFINPKVV